MQESQRTRQLVGDFIEQITTGVSFETRFDAYRRLAESIGFDGVLYTYIPTIIMDGKTGMEPVFETSDGYDKTFVAQYFDESLHHDDYTIRMVNSGADRPLDWWLDHAAGRLSEKEHHVIEVARSDYGIRNGVTLPLMSGSRGIAGVSAVSREHKRSFIGLKASALPTLERCGRVLHNSVLTDSDNGRRFMPFLSTLNEKEKIVLRFLASGKPLKTVEDGTGISYNYVTRHLLPSLREKLGSVTKDQLIYYAGLFSLADCL